MDYDDFRAVLDSSRVDVWTFIETAISVAAVDYSADLKQRRDGIVERLYSSTTVIPGPRNIDSDRHFDSEVKSSVEKERVSPPTPESVGKENESNDDVDELDPYGGLFDDEQKSILEIKEQLEDPDQSEDSLLELLQSLADMDITFQALKESDIRRDVNRLRKHSSSEVQILVKKLVRKWKEIVDEWVKTNQPGEQGSFGLMGDGDSPQQKSTLNGHHQVPDFGYSPNPHTNGGSGSDKSNSEPERKPKAIPPRQEIPPKPTKKSVPSLASQNKHREPKESNFDSDKLASARKRLQESYKEAENAKKQRTIQVMDIHDIPKPKNRNVFFPKNKGGGGHGSSQGRHW